MPRDITRGLLLVSCLAQAIQAHDHHDDRIPEGAAISPDPIVCFQFHRHEAIKWVLTGCFKGCHVMGAHDNSDRRVRLDISNRHGLGGKDDLHIEQASRGQLLKRYTDHPFTMACSRPDSRHYNRHTRILPGSRSQGSPIREEHPRLIRQLPDADAGASSCVRNLPQVSLGKGNPCSRSANCIESSRYRGESDAGG